MTARQSKHSRWWIPVAILAAGMVASPAVAPVPVIWAADSETMEEFADRLDTQLNTCSVELITTRLDAGIFLGRAFEGIDVQETFKAGMFQGFKKSLGELCSPIESGGWYRLLHLREREGHTTAVFRLLMDSGVNYHEYLLVPGPGGKVRIGDIYVALSGEWLSRTLRDSGLPLIVEQNKSVLEKLLTRESDYVRNFPRLIEMRKKMQAGDQEGAMRLYKSLPASVQNSRIGLMYRYQIALETDETAYKAAMAALEKRFGDDPSVSLMLLDHHYFNEHWAKALETIDGLDRAFGGDPYLDVLRSGVELSRGNTARASELARAATEAEPYLEDAWWTRITVSLGAEDFVETARLLDEIQARFDIELADLTTVPEYAGFVNSPVYGDWLAAQE